MADKKAIENQIYGRKILMGKAVNQTLADSYQKEIDMLEAELTKPEKKPEKKSEKKSKHY